MWVGIGPDQELQEICDLGIPAIKIIKPYRDTDKIFQKLEAAEKAGCIAVGMDIDFAFGSKSGDFLKANDWCSPKTSAELASFIAATKLPFIFKGVLSERDAYKAMELGAGGIVISSHSGNAIDYAVPPMKILPKIAKIADRKIPVFIDGDIKHGSDVFKALALGADGALAGRSLMAGMELDGAEGITKVVNGITEELRRNMCLTGAASIGEIDPSVLWLP
jgi:isopentenyl diphosphate isomerase/L-lactate dehydrogenase-like FMN-dependent dehydrogenase